METLVLLAGLLVLEPLGIAGDAETPVLVEKVVAGGPEDFMTVRHLRLRGSQVEIGRELARLAVRRWNVQPWPSRDPDVTRVQRQYLSKNWPTHVSRMEGSAEVLEGSLDDDRQDYSTLTFNTGDFFACSAAYYPPEWTQRDTGVFSRNLDFTAGSLVGKSAGVDGPAALSEPFVVECYPEEGYASLFVCSMDLLGSAFDGVNEKGLTAALLTDRDLMTEYAMQPTQGLSVGLNEIQTVRFLLETCATVGEAKDALLENKQYYGFVPCHYLVADANGDAMVVEASHSRNQVHFVTDPGEPLLTTNFMRHRHPDLDILEPTGNPGHSFDRFLAMRDGIDQAGFPLELDAIKQIHRTVFCTGPAPPEPWAAHRTLWHALYYPEEMRVEVDFYLGDTPALDAPGGTKIRRSGYLEFRLTDT